MIMEFKTIFSSFLTSPELQLAAVYALQVFAFSRSFPKGMLLRWFVALYEADIVDEHVFLKWKEDVNDRFPGKGKALFQVNQKTKKDKISRLFCVVITPYGNLTTLTTALNN